MYSASGEFRAEAENEGLSPGKYLIYEQLKETGDQVSIDDVRNNNIRESGRYIQAQPAAEL